jgi:tetratricopeptide (TPR) repeat protein
VAIFGDEHCNLLNAKRYFSYIYGQKRKLTDAAKLHEQVLAKAQVFFVYDHCTETLSSMSNVAWIYRRQGRFAEAVKLYEQILATMEAVFGENHPDTVAAWGGLAFTYVQHGRMRDAVRLGWVIMKKYWTNQK